MGHQDEEIIPPVVAVLTYFAYAVLMLFGYLRDFFGHIFKPEKYKAPVVRSVLSNWLWFSG
jgi:hypothetical protein